HGTQHSPLHLDERRCEGAPGSSRGISECPGPTRQVAPLALVQRMDLRGQPIDGSPWRRPPLLLTRHVVMDPAAAGRAPAIDAVCAAPRAGRDDFYRLGRGGGMRRERRGEVRQSYLPAVLQPVGGGRWPPAAGLVVMAEGLTVYRDRRDGAAWRPLQSVGPAIGLALQ